MEKTIFKHLEFLLPMHNCVVIPDFGGFIANIETVSFDIDGKLNPPKYYIVFNPELTHDDGILASYIMKDENITYNSACTKIKIFVNSIKSDLKQGKTIYCGNIGTLKSNEAGNPVFNLNKAVIYPAFWGLESTNIKQLIEIDKTLYKEKRNLSIKYTLSTITAAAAAILLFIAPSNNIEDHNSPQGASFISSITKELPTSNTIENNTKDITPAIIEVKKEVPSRMYYIIIGGDESKNRADKLLSKTIQAGFPNAAIVETSDRYRIYISSFENKSEGEAFLNTFRKENPKYESAWLFSKKN